MRSVTTPIVVGEGNDLSFYGSLADAELDLEPVDVRNRIYDAFDSEGYPLVIEVVPPDTDASDKGTRAIERVRLRIAPEVQAAPEVVRKRIEEFCSASSPSVEVPKGVGVKALVTWAHSRFGA